jgi:phosphotransferase family enzyme
VSGVETEITAELVRDLLRDQHPDLAGRPLMLGARGWDNQMWRLGGDLAVWLPWATLTADALLRKEHAWLPSLASRLPLPVPVPQRLGEPSVRFPRPWIVTTWVSGEPADRVPVTRGEEAANALAGFPTALHQHAPAGAPRGRNRGGPLAGHAEGFAGFLTEATDLGLIADPGAVARSGTMRLQRRRGKVCRCGSTVTCTQPISSPRTARSAAWSTSATCAQGIRPATWLPAGFCCPTALLAGSTRHTSRAWTRLP